jgi:hypothetical protein
MHPPHVILTMHPPRYLIFPFYILFHNHNPTFWSAACSVQGRTTIALKNTSDYGDLF